MKKYIKQYGTSYYIANSFFPRELSKDVMVVYAFVRIPDDIVDENTTDIPSKTHLLDKAQKNAYKILKGTASVDKRADDAYSERLEVCQAMKKVVEKYEIPFAWIEAFFDAMRQDLTKHRYDTYESLQQYMYGSAQVIGLIMAEMIGYDTTRTKQVLYHAKLLGEAMQYTNFLRDIAEDWKDFGRVYIPTERLAQFGITHDDIIASCTDHTLLHPNWNAFMAHEIAYCHTLYKQANRGIILLDAQGRRAVFYASGLYESIVQKIQQNNYDVFSKKSRLTKLEKIRKICTLSYKYKSATKNTFNS